MQTEPYFALLILTFAFVRCGDYVSESGEGLTGEENSSLLYSQLRTPKVALERGELASDIAWKLQPDGTPANGSAMCEQNWICEGQLGSACSSLILKEFGFDIPSRAVIQQIEVVLDRMSSNSQSVQDAFVRLRRESGFVGQNFARSLFWTTYWEEAIFPSVEGQDPLWGGDWNPGHFNDVAHNFEVVIRSAFYKINDTSFSDAPVQALVRCVSVRVYYSFQTCSTKNNCSGNGRCNENGICEGFEGYESDDCSQNTFQSGVGWAALIAITSLGSMIFGFAIAASFYMAKQKPVTSFERQEDHTEEIQLEVTSPATNLNVAASTAKPSSSEWKQVSNSKEWFL
eukprot:TRINITY_DN12197_c0_g1_i1.p1 TRINITY_DN12197_c0_g1~~TRINITY_DN12197_c0_g1_i1.p1  ORF type:complete len:343 (-),score=78.07 TRINITY_DN12197_c0_g1_i1:18-1046(-)